MKKCVAKVKKKNVMKLKTKRIQQYFSNLNGNEREEEGRKEGREREKSNHGREERRVRR